MADNHYESIIKQFRRRSEQQEEIAHEERVAEIRARSRALVWTGPETELIETIRKSYEAGWLHAADLQDALRQASLHFVRADGTAVIQPQDLQHFALAPQQEIKQPPSTAQEIERRKALLAEYKAATGVTSNHKIYGAKNSQLHKPQFYEWINGELSAESVTAQNFERFLREKKQPIPRERRR